MIALFSLAFAIDFIPTWDETTREAPDLLQEVAPKEVVVSAAEPFDTPTHSFELDPDPRHPWLDESSITLAIAGDWGRRYYVVSTVIAAGTVSHWQQGPYDTPDSTLPVQLEVPSDVRESMERADFGHVNVTVMGPGRPRSHRCHSSYRSRRVRRDVGWAEQLRHGTSGLIRNQSVRLHGAS